MPDEPLCDDVGHECVRVVLALPASNFTMSAGRRKRVGQLQAIALAATPYVAPDCNAGGGIDRADRAPRSGN